ARRRQEPRQVGMGQAERASSTAIDIRLVDDRKNGPCDQVPIAGKMEWDDRLDVEDVLCVVVRGRPEIEVVHDRDVEDVRQGILRLLGEVGEARVRLLAVRARWPRGGGEG